MLYEFTTEAALLDHYAGVHRRLSTAPAKPEPEPEPIVAPAPVLPPPPLVRRLNPVRTIIHATSRHSGIGVTEILSHRCRADLVRARHMAMYLAYRLTTLSYPQIGRHFGWRDHSTILHAVRKITRLLPGDPALAADVQAIREAAVAADPTLGVEI